jgi:hypothetical protein
MSFATARERVPFDPALAASVCERVRRGVRLTALGDEPGIPGWDVVADWLSVHPDFMDDFDAAQSDHCHLLAEECRDLAGRFGDDPDANDRLRLRIEVREWLISCRNPELFRRMVAEGAVMEGGWPGDA